MPSASRQAHGWLGRKRTMAIAFGVLLLAAWGFFGELMRNRSLEAELSGLDSRVVALENEVSATARKAQLMAGDQAAEREARTKLGLMRPGEQVVIIRGAASVEAAPSAPPPSDRIANWRKWWNYLFN